jgi:type II secretory ATPase GspE/PulE/Tfp pilus assembly ATPase PilB-like protein
MEKNHAAALLDDIFARAVELRASDIHLEPREQFLRVRFRVDGLLQEGKPVHKSQQAALLSRLKVLFDLDIAETRVPQDGRSRFNALDIRASIVPTLHGEKAVLRLLDRKQAGLDLEDLGMEPEDLACYRRMVARRSGIILITGPTGSGKTTTLYATLAALKHKELNITTIEDPVEYQLPSINQIQVNNKAGLTFANGLRSILRQDPDIIMVGEIRDLETARIALQAALTGHLVFSTLHTGDAAAATARLTDMGIEKYLVEAAVVGVVAQRLVRRVAGGRTAVYELLPGGSGRSLMANGRLKVKNGITTEEELARTIALEN